MASLENCSTFPDGTTRITSQVQAPRLPGVKNPKSQAALAFLVISVTTFFQLGECCAAKLERSAVLLRPFTLSERTPVAPLEEWRMRIMQRSSAASPIAVQVPLRVAAWRADQSKTSVLSS